MVEADTKNFNGYSYIHEKNDIFNDRESAERHANELRKKYKFITRVKIESQADGTYWVWWTNKKL